MRKEIVILGAGPAGMSCAMELFKAGKSSMIIEKESRVGGLAATLNFREGDLLFRTDIGPHRFFSKNAYLYSFIGDLLKEKWIKVNRQTRQFIDGKFYDYPINAMQAFKNIGFFRSMSMGASYVAGISKYRLMKKDITSFEDYVIANFGKKLGEFNMLNYTEKIWGVPCSELHPDWARQRIKGLNFVSALKNAVLPKKEKDGPKSLIDIFYYPQYGTGLIYETIAQKIDKTSEILLESYPMKINVKGDKIESVEYAQRGRSRTVYPENCISSIPITEFLSLINPAPPREVLEAANKLRWRSQVYLFITLDKDYVTKDNWVYFPSKEIPFGRIAEMKNFSVDMSPKDKTSVFVEYYVNEGDEIWNMDKESLFNLSLPFFEEIGFFKKAEVRNYYLLKKKKVYPIYDLTYQDHLKIVKDYLDSISNLTYIGRPGRFKYNNQDHSLEMGILAAKGIVDGKRYDIENVGAENEYFEKGDVKDGAEKN